MTVFRFAPYVLKSLWRHRARSVLTVSGSAVALFVFCMVGAVQKGLESLTRQSQADRTLVVFQENRFCPASSRLPEDYARTVAKMPGVTDVVPIKVLTNNCRASLDVVVFNGLPAAQLRAARQLELLAGNWGDFESRTDGAVAGQAVAQRRNLKAGQKFTMGEVTVSIAGVFKSAVPAEDNFIYTHLDFLQRARGRNTVGTVTQLEVQLAESADPDATAAAIDVQFRSGPVATTTKSKGVFQRETLSDLAELIGFAHWLGYACLGLVLSLVATTTVMAVQDRIKEHAVLQTLGVRPLRVFRLVLAESLLQTLAGGLLGVGLGMLLLGWSGFSVGAEGVTIVFQPSADLAVGGLVVSVVVGVAAGLVPGWQAARTEIVTALRQA
ncbi:MAG: ABC transporter permease [Pirellulaceae bacterium]